VLRSSVREEETRRDKRDRGRGTRDRWREEEEVIVVISP